MSSGSAIDWEDSFPWHCLSAYFRTKSKLNLVFCTMFIIIAFSQEKYLHRTSSCFWRLYKPLIWGVIHHGVGSMNLMGNWWMTCVWCLTLKDILIKSQMYLSGQAIFTGTLPYTMKLCFMENLVFIPTQSTLSWQCCPFPSEFLWLCSLYLDVWKNIPTFPSNGAMIMLQHSRN